MDDEVFAKELLAMAAEDGAVREELARDGSLFGGYHPRMREVHDRNAARLARHVERHGWPSRARVGDAAADAAWTIVQHAIGHPALQRSCLALLRERVATGDVRAEQLAMLEDRVRAFEGRGQLYGTQFDWDADGEMSPLPLDDPTGVDARRRAMGLPPLAEEVARRRRAVAESTERPPADVDAYRRGKEAWLREVGWRE